MSGTGFPSKVLLCPGCHSRANRRYYGAPQRPSTGLPAGGTNPDEGPPANLQDATLELARVVLPRAIRHRLAVQTNGAFLDLPPSVRVRRGEPPLGHQPGQPEPPAGG